ncbi:MAG: CRISPR system precrRNA processing endoribonuclease RAMP protein Cas6 [Chloroflexi bacterium]|nr:CRISPR system precrRNA processing endoribonuclease RAMP protein Cas6 [Chloroflexota bacterium]
MFLSAIIPLTPTNAPAPETNRFFGREAHALFLGLVRDADPALAESLHEPRGEKPFTVSILTAHPLLPLSSPDSKYQERREGVGGSGVRFLRFTAFEPRLAQTLAENVLPTLRVPREIRLGNARFTTGAPITDRAAHPWAATRDPRALVDHWFASDARLDSRVTLQFLTPTAHRAIHRNILFPQPAQLWGGWLRAWNAYAQPAFEDDLIMQVEQNVALSQYALKTEVVDFGEFRQAGWVGRATFTCFGKERALWRVLQLLADFAFYCGTGYKTTQGMGVTRKIETLR